MADVEQPLTECCGTCLFFWGPKPAPENVPAAAAAVFDHGDCHRFPRTEKKRPADWCGEWQLPAEPEAAPQLTPGQGASEV